MSSSLSLTAGMGSVSEFLSREREEIPFLPLSPPLPFLYPHPTLTLHCSEVVGWIGEKKGKEEGRGKGRLIPSLTLAFSLSIPKLLLSFPSFPYAAKPLFLSWRQQRMGGNSLAISFPYLSVIRFSS